MKGKKADLVAAVKLCMDGPPSEAAPLAVAADDCLENNDPLADMQDEEIDEAFAATDAESFDADEPFFF